jgi:MFS transporter, ACS family, D-galactonate transporter
MEKTMSLRYRLLGLTWLLQFVNYLDRVSISVTAPSMMKTLQLDASQIGLIFGAFAVGYAVMQLPGGLLSDRFGAKTMLVGAPLLFSLFTGLTGLASTLGVLILVRFCFGLAEGSSNAAVYKVVSDNFTTKEAARAHSVWLSALALGPALVAPIVVMFLTYSTWRHVFYFFSIPGVIVSLLILLMIPARKNEARTERVERAERRRQWGEILQTRTTWLLFVAYLTFNIGYWGFLGWMPTYLAIQRHIDLKTMGYAASVPYLFGFLGLIVFGTLGSGALHRRRPLLVAAGGLAAAAALYLTFTCNDVLTCLVGLSVAAFLLYGMLAPYASLVSHFSPERARGGFAGLINTGGQIGGMASPLVVGYIVKASGSFNAAFLFMIVAMVMSAASFALLQPHLARKPALLVNAQA